MGSIVELSVREFVAEVNEAEREAKGARDYWTMTKNPPKVSREVLLRH